MEFLMGVINGCNKVHRDIVAIDYDFFKCYMKAHAPGYSASP